MTTVLAELQAWCQKRWLEVMVPKVQDFNIFQQGKHKFCSISSPKLRPSIPPALNTNSLKPTLGEYWRSLKGSLVDNVLGQSLAKVFIFLSFWERKIALNRDSPWYWLIWEATWVGLTATVWSVSYDETSLILVVGKKKQSNKTAYVVPSMWVEASNRKQNPWMKEPRNIGWRMHVCSLAFSGRSYDTYIYINIHASIPQYWIPLAATCSRVGWDVHPQNVSTVLRRWWWEEILQHLWCPV